MKFMAYVWKARKPGVFMWFRAVNLSELQFCSLQNKNNKVLIS